LVGWLVGRLVGWLVGRWSVGWLVGWLAGWLVGWLVHQLVGLGHKFLDNASQSSLNGSARNFHTSLVWSQALGLTYPTHKEFGGENFKFR